MLLLHLVRHGQTSCSAAGVLCGRGCDVPLNAAGEAMARCVGSAFAHGSLRAIIASTQRRAHQSASIIAGAVGLSVEQNAAFCELDYGRWDGKRRAELTDRDHEAFLAWEADPFLHPPPGGETVRELSARVASGLSQLCNRFDDGEVLLVSHKTTLRALLCGMLSIDVRDYRRRLAYPLAAISTVALTAEGPRLCRHADLAHLSPELLALCHD